MRAVLPSPSPGACLAARPEVLMPCRSVASAAALVALLLASTASAPIDLNEPPARHDDPLEDQKAGPCGVAGSPRSADPMVLQPGETVTIQWDETIDHDSH